MKSLREAIRRIILESPELQDQLDQLIHNREDDSFLAPEDSTSHQDYALKNRWKNDPSKRNYALEKFDDNVSLRKKVKSFWNDNADHNFWDTKIAALHSLTYYGPVSSSMFEDAEFESNKDLPVASFFMKHPPYQRQKHEMSCFGCYDTEQEIADRIMHSRGDLGICVKLKGRVTWASSEDSYTESRGEATADDLARHAGSGLPKRAAVSRQFSGRTALFGEEDLKKADEIGELVVDNWYWDTLYVDASMYPRYIIRDLSKLCKKYKVDLVKITKG